MLGNEYAGVIVFTEQLPVLCVDVSLRTRIAGARLVLSLIE